VFFWPTLFRGAHLFYVACEHCQHTSALLHRDMMPLSLILIVDIFDLWGIDFMGPFRSPFGFVCILVAVDYISRWVEPQATRTIDHKFMVKFVKECIFY